ncbi:MAG: L-aspartate oxidase [Anaerovoracaceae bacterium]|jgi:L-aspartate oxidase
MKQENLIGRRYDEIIVGTGAAGLFAALHLPADHRVLMITKDVVENSDSYLAQGGICCELSDEDYQSFYDDTLKAGRYENDPEAVRNMIQQSRRVNQELADYGVDFDKKEDGRPDYTREGGHSKFRILHHQDVTGQEICSKLIERARERSNIEMREFVTMVDILEEENRCHGIVIRDAEGRIGPVYARAVVLATGGLGGLFRRSSNFRHITGDSFAIASKHGVKLKNIEYIQIHPTVFYSKKPGRAFLISESVRGEGAVLLNEDGERFTDELQPRDVVSQAIKKEMDKYGTDHVYLSLHNIPESVIKTHFRHIYEYCLEEGYDITKEPIPVTPAQHYLMGGIEADICGRTSMEDLYAIGETACNGVHGANRLASNSLLESIVFAENAARTIVEKNAPQWEKEDIVDVSLYSDPEKLAKENREIVMKEIEKNGEAFYALWSNI